MFNAVGLGGLDIGWLFIVIFILLIVMIVLVVVTMKRYEAMKSRYDKFMGGKRATSLEERMQDMVKDVERLK